MEILFLVFRVFDLKLLKKQKSREIEVCRYRCICVVYMYMTDLRDKESASNLVQTGNASPTRLHVQLEPLDETDRTQDQDRKQGPKKNKRRRTKQLRDGVIALD